MNLDDIIAGARWLCYLIALGSWLPVGISLRAKAHGENAWLQRRLGFSIVMVGLAAGMGFLTASLFMWGKVSMDVGRHMMTFVAMLLAVGGIDLGIFWYRANGRRQ